ncbi:helix-turn-helix domain-containing protein [Paraburkholderia sp. GAS348]|uniref:helix-turn-helix domain-containing protein n=1 Tax=Paraburkholderia sp. GAS348 TaxID=3035132 RepID=UPI003D1D984A
MTTIRIQPRCILGKIADTLQQALAQRAPLASLAAAAGLSEFYFLRTFQRVTGVTPHQYVLRARLRAAALRLHDDSAKVVDIALDCGFNDLSNFNHAFRAEFASSPRAWRARGRARRA